ncbi:MAG: CDP-glycerol glycerophosphotransferase family protein [Lachnospiraceae bacterium]|nr:CDP-glycerol glycerophosphotransferase family protein [Lachnospiraceae bacterium]
MIKSIIRNILKLLWILPVKKNRVVFRSFQGASYSCNPKYISEYITKNRGDEYEQIWLFKNPKKYTFLRKKGIKVIPQTSLRAVYYLITAGFLIDNLGVQSYIPLRKKQTVINTWHGGGSYKKIYKEATKEHVDYLQLMMNSTTYFISSCARFSANNIKYLHDNAPEKILEIGMPRNDIFFGNHDGIERKVKKKLNIPNDTKLVLYAPTFRDDVDASVYVLDVDRILAALSERFGGDFVFLLRFHWFTDDHNPYEDNEHVIDVTSYDDMQELLYASSVLITDYSSCIWDASLSYKPCFIYAPDLDVYLGYRNFFTPVNEWPFPMARDIDALCDEIIHFDEEHYKKEVDRHHTELGSAEHGTASRTVVALMDKISHKK